MERLKKISISSEHPLSLGNFLNLAEIGENKKPKLEGRGYILYDSNCPFFSPSQTHVISEHNCPSPLKSFLIECDLSTEFREVNYKN